MTEIEIKLPFASAAEARRRIETLGAVEREPRRHEDNVVLDRSNDTLRSAGRLLRLRTTGDRTLLTYKRRIDDAGPHKVAEEHETGLDDAAAMTALLAGLGFAPAYRYEKYRTVFALEDLLICLDETPIGCYVELEGAPERIDDAARRLGFAPRDYVRSTYLDLHRQAIDEGRARPGDMVFAAAERRP